MGTDQYHTTRGVAVTIGRITDPGTFPNFDAMTRKVGWLRSGTWTTVLGYGLVMAVLVSVLKYVEYSYWVRDLRVEVYVGVVAMLFTALGVWIGWRVLRDRQKEPPPPAELVVNEEAVRTLGISPREMEVLRLMSEGCSNQEIADKLFISLPTVKSHSSNLFVKLDVNRRTQAVHKAKEVGILV